jgi:hypothetical protein
MRREVYIGTLFFLGIFCLAGVSSVQADPCPTGTRYAAIQYNHQLLNQYVAVGTFSQASGLSGLVGIQVSPSGIVNAGNNMLTRTIDLVYTTPDCDCLADTATSQVTVTITGTCSNGTLNMQVHEVYPESSALVTCTGDDNCPIYTQTYPGSTNSYDLNMNYVDGTTIVQPYSCPDCSGTYSWRLQFTSEPPPEDDVQTVPLAPLLHLMLRQANQ